MKKLGILLKKKVIGFTGAPWTLLVYMLHKKSPKKNFKFNNTFKRKITPWITKKNRKEHLFTRQKTIQRRSKYYSNF